MGISKKIVIAGLGIGLAILGCNKSDSSSSSSIEQCDPTSWKTIDDFLYSSNQQNVQSGVTLINDGAQIINAYYSVMSGDSNYRLILRRSEDGGRTWVNKLIARSYGTFAEGGLGTNQNQPGILFAKEVNNTRFMLKKSTDNGSTWLTTYDVPIANSLMGKLYLDNAAKVLYRFYPKAISNILSHWEIARSADDGASWVVVDTFYLDSSKSAMPTAMTEALDGSLYVVGNAIDSSNVKHTIVRKSSDGLSWASIEDHSEAGTAATNQSVATSSDGQKILVAMFQTEPNNVAKWVVRASSNGGASWGTVDSYATTYDGQVSSPFPTSVALSPLGDFYVAGSAPNGIINADQASLVRTSTDLSTWANSDSFQSNGATTAGEKIFVDASGNVYLMGNYAPNDLYGTTKNFIRMKPSCR